MFFLATFTYLNMNISKWINTPSCLNEKNKTYFQHMNIEIVVNKYQQKSIQNKDPRFADI